VLCGVCVLCVCVCVCVVMYKVYWVLCVVCLYVFVCVCVDVQSVWCVVGCMRGYVECNV
jgi:hypothetical protein